MRAFAFVALFALACGASSTLPEDRPEADAGERADAGEEALNEGVLYDDCGPADGPAIRGFITAGAPVCDGSRMTTDTPRLEIYAAGSGPSWSVADDFTTFRYCTASGCEDATAGTFEVDPPMGSRTTVQVSLQFPSVDLEGGYVVALCEDDVLCG